MAVGKGSMERASKAAVKTVEPAVRADEAASVKTAALKKTAVPAKTAAAKKPAAKKTPAKAAPRGSAAAVIPAPGPEVMEKILYQNSTEMLYRDAEPNERFEVGDSMPVYYF